MRGRWESDTREKAEALTRDAGGNHLQTDRWLMLRGVDNMRLQRAELGELVPHPQDRGLIPSGVGSRPLLRTSQGDFTTWSQHDVTARGPRTN